MTTETRKLSPDELREISEAHGVCNGPISAHFTETSYGIASTADRTGVALSHVCELASQVPSFLLTIEERDKEMRRLRKAIQVMAAYPDFFNTVEAIARIGGEDAPHALCIWDVFRGEE